MATLWNVSHCHVVAAWMGRGWAEDKSATLYFQAQLGEHLLAYADIEFQKQSRMS